ncbi:class I SAM-dependent methyltransferase [Paenibacillus sp. GSMTC-2017]|uniref:class I SAM-dependent methyltransferase n=1 Tax=Paenibacillus sp. GSMTC-2017 TaxID=2794350 RepID=UPI0018D7C67B|nr:class I SAM-dependent methyltransferase [Paenibacillus sp. GSMTC-2017]MBH5318214.1 class I SAM-dependent methyltransferase [Paenibacillus sp. GSMTC-2017]
MEKPQYEQVGVAMTCRSYDDYLCMFRLTEDDLAQGAILDIAGGGSSFTAEARKRGYEAFAVDPRYGADVVKLVSEARQEIETSTAKIEALKEHFDWSYYGSVDLHRRGRISALNKFAEHVGLVGSGQHYIDGKLPELPFENNTFSNIMCSHFMFLYGAQFDFAFHLQSIREMLRIIKPNGHIRIYPLTTLQFQPYERLDELIGIISEEGGIVEQKESQLPFIPGSKHYLHIQKKS